MTFEVSDTDKVANLLTRIEERSVAFDRRTVRLYHVGKALMEQNWLSDYNVHEDATIFMVAIVVIPERFKIFVKMTTGETLTMKVCRPDSVGQLKSKILQRQGDAALVEQYGLNFRG